MASDLPSLRQSLRATLEGPGIEIIEAQSGPEALARSTDGGRTFRNYAWSAQAFGGENAFLGDYEWLAASGGRVYGIWAEAAPEGYVLDPRPDGTPQVSRRTPTIIRVGTADFRPSH